MEVKMLIAQITEWTLITIAIIMALLLCVCLIRAVKGPTIADRLMAVNMSGTMTIVMIGILAVLTQKNYVIDICLIYAMISFVAVIVLSKVYLGTYLEQKAKEEQRNDS